MPEQPTAQLKTEDYKPKLGLNRDEIKHIAMLTMLLNHTAHTLLTAGSTAYVLCVAVGYFTAITMCYFLVEGYGYTRNKKKYALRLLGFALLSQVPYGLAFGQGSILGAGFNMLFTLLLCFALVHVYASNAAASTKSLVFVLILFASTLCDWALMAPIFTRLFIWARQGSRKRQGAAFGLGAGLFAVYHFLQVSQWLPVHQALGQSLLYALPVAAAGLVLHFCYNGERAQHGKVFYKWFFYLFYPCHLLVLVFLRDFVSL